MMVNIGRKLIAAPVVALALWGAPASAGTYTVLSCKDRAGGPAAINDPSGGWQSGSTGGPGLDWENHCSEPSNGLQAAVSGSVSRAVGSQVWWRFTAPNATSIDSVRLLYSSYTRPSDGVNFGTTFIQASQTGFLTAERGLGTVYPRWVERAGLGDAWVQATAQCDGPAGGPNCAAGTAHAFIVLVRSEIALRDESPPNAGTASGSAVSSPEWEGTHVFEFPASDQGGGVYQAILFVDGQPLLARTIDDRGGRCVDTTAGGRVFTFPQPCPGSADALVPIDANALPPGVHDVELRVSDAAGNLRTVYTARKTIVAPDRRVGPGSDPAERGAANGDGASDVAHLSVRWARHGARTITVPYGRRDVIRGRLTAPSGRGISHARIELLAAIDGRKGPRLDKGGARTRRDGRFTLILPANACSRTLVLRYRSHVNDTVAVAEATLRLQVRAGIRLRVTPRIAARGQTVKLSGRLLGRPLPVRGKVVELQARSAGEPWITFRTVRASRRGRFVTRYTFHRDGPATYLMRARVRAADDYPYATGSSNAVRVRVR